MIRNKPNHLMSKVYLEIEYRQITWKIVDTYMNFHSILFCFLFSFLLHVFIYLVIYFLTYLFISVCIYFASGCQN